ncbi:MAG: elongation factor P, partial [bacterium]|nr:elongation factor P [bacterium]
HGERRAGFMAMLTINDIKNGDFIVIDGAPYQVLSVKHLHIGRGGSSVQTKIKNVKTGQVFERNYKPSDSFGEADLLKFKVQFVYAHRGEYWFMEPGKPQSRFSLKEDTIGEAKNFLKKDLEAVALKWNDQIINIELPIKVDYVVVDAPPAVRGDTAQGGTKQVSIENGYKVLTPLFIEAGDVIRLNTETGEYVERVSKA